MTRKYSWESTYDATAGDAVLFIRNAAPRRILMITSIMLGSVANNRFRVSRVTGDPAGTGVDGQNRSSLAPDATPGSDGSSFGNAAVTSLSEGAILARARVEANTSREITFEREDFILGPGDAMAVFSDVSGVMEVTVMGEYA